MDIKVMKSLIYRRFLLMRKSIVIVLLGVVLFMVIGWLVLLSMQIGNLRNIFNSPEEKESTAKMLATLIGIPVTALLASMTGDGFIFTEDIKCRWKEYSASTRIRPVDNAISRFFVTLIILASAIAGTMLNFLVTSLISGEPVSMKDVNISFAIIDMIIFMNMLETPVFLRAKTEKQILSAPFVSFGLMIVVAAVFSKKIASWAHMLQSLPEETELSDLMPMVNEFADKYLAYSIPALIVLLILFAAVNVLFSGKRVSR